MKNLGERQRHTYDLLLLLVSFFWGSTFILVKRAVEHADVFSFLAVRFALASALLSLGLGRRWRRADRPLVAELTTRSRGAAPARDKEA